jgi:RNA polymerase sigma-70 factor (ECF subfamily)
MPGTQETAHAPDSDEQLMMAFSRGVTSAFDELFSRYKQPLYGFFRRRLSDPAHAEELTQDTFVAVLRATERYQPTALFRTYLYAIGFKVLRTHRRKAAFWAVFHGSTAQEPATESNVETEVWMRDALRKLDPRDREILMLREFEQLTYAEIAELLDMPVNTIRSRLFRARMALRELLVSPAPAIPARNFAESDLKERV